MDTQPTRKRPLSDSSAPYHQHQNHHHEDQYHGQQEYHFSEEPLTQEDPIEKNPVDPPYPWTKPSLHNFLLKREIQSLPTPRFPYNSVPHISFHHPLLQVDLGPDDSGVDSNLGEWSEGDDDASMSSADSYHLFRQADTMWMYKEYSVEQCLRFMHDNHLRFMPNDTNQILCEFFEKLRKPKHVRNPNSNTVRNIMDKLQPLLQCTLYSFTVNPFIRARFREYPMYTLRACLGCQRDHIFQRVKEILLQANPSLHPACDENAPIFDDEDEHRSVAKLTKYLNGLLQKPISTKKDFQVHKWARKVLKEIELATPPLHP